MAAGDLARAWALLRLDRDYRAAWQAHAARPVYEENAPPDRGEPVPATEPGGQTLPVRIRLEADRIAERDWSLFAWEDPDGDAVAAFFDVPMLEGEGSATAPPLVPMLGKHPVGTVCAGR